MSTFVLWVAIYTFASVPTTWSAADSYESLRECREAGAALKETHEAIIGKGRSLLLYKCLPPGVKP